jgi:hypothetical protein
MRLSTRCHVGITILGRTNAFVCGKVPAVLRANKVFTAVDTER